jgi:hypothetical protein
MVELEDEEDVQLKEKRYPHSSEPLVAMPAA